MSKINNTINKIMEENHLEYFKLDGQYWIISEVLAGEHLINKLCYSTNCKNEDELLTHIKIENLTELYEYLK